MLLYIVVIILVFVLISGDGRPNVSKIIENCKYEQKTDLCDLMETHGSDKSTAHNYTTIYSDIFKDIRFDNLNIFEVGLGTLDPNIGANMSGYKNTRPGSSLRAWRDYFPNANVYGADIDEKILFTEDRIKTFWVDQLNADAIKYMWSNIPEQFDIIIDDGLHTSDANRTFLLNSHHKLKDGGVYIIEDVNPDEFEKHKADMKLYEKYFKTVRYVQLPITPARGDNNLIILQK